MQHLIRKIDIDCCIPCFQYIPIECPTLLLKLGYAVKLNQVQLDVHAFKSILKKLRCNWDPYVYFWPALRATHTSQHLQLTGNQIYTLTLILPDY